MKLQGLFVRKLQPCKARGLESTALDWQRRGLHGGLGGDGPDLEWRGELGINTKKLTGARGITGESFLPVLFVWGFLNLLLMVFATFPRLPPCILDMLPL